MKGHLKVIAKTRHVLVDLIAMHIRKSKNMTMIHSKVTYVVEQSFADINKQNIKTFLAEAKSLNHPGIHFTILLGKDGKTFTHIGRFLDVEAQRTFLELPSFKLFQQERDKRLEIQPTIEFVEEVGSTHKIFN